MVKKEIKFALFERTGKKKNEHLGGSDDDDNDDGVSTGGCDNGGVDFNNNIAHAIIIVIQHSPFHGK